MFVLHVYLCIMRMPGALRGQKKESDPWELESHRVVNCQVNLSRSSESLCYFSSSHIVYLGSFEDHPPRTECFSSEEITLHLQQHTDSEQGCSEPSHLTWQEVEEPFFGQICSCYRVQECNHREARGMAQWLEHALLFKRVWVGDLKPTGQLTTACSSSGGSFRPPLASLSTAHRCCTSSSQSLYTVCVWGTKHLVGRNNLWRLGIAPYIHTVTMYEAPCSM